MEAPFYNLDELYNEAIQTALLNGGYSLKDICREGGVSYSYMRRMQKIGKPMIALAFRAAKELPLYHLILDQKIIEDSSVSKTFTIHYKLAIFFKERLLQQEKANNSL